MKRIPFALLGLLFVIGCGSPEEQMADTMNEIADVLETIKDKESAEDAADDLEDLAQRMKDIQKEVGDDYRSKDIPEDVQKELAEAGGRLMKEMMRVASIPEARKVLDKIDMK